jgi:hypothetical protein
MDASSAVRRAVFASRSKMASELEQPFLNVLEVVQYFVGHGSLSGQA